MEALDLSEEITQKYTPDVIAELSKTLRSGIEVKDRRHLFNFYPMSFVGKELNQWLLTNGHAENIHEAVSIGNHLMENKVFHHLMSKGEFTNEYLLYRFEVDEKEFDLPDTKYTWHSILKENNGKIILPEEIEKYIGDHTDWHIKSPGPHHFHELLIDPFNCDTLDNVRPIKFTDPDETHYDMIAIGSGAGGLVTGITASSAGGKSCIIEQNASGGDWLNTGCVPSKAFIKSAKIAHSWKTAELCGIETEGVRVNFPKVMERLRAIRAKISNSDSVFKTTKKYGVDFFLGHAKFISQNQIQVNDKVLTFEKAWIATGGAPYIPEIDGLDDFPYFTSENIFNLTEQPKNLLVVGAGPIGCELGQSFARLGTKVTMITRDNKILPKEDFDAASYVHEQMMNDGVQIYLKTKIIKANVIANPGKVWKSDAWIELDIDHRGKTITIQADSILFATGRRPNVHNLGLEEAGIEFDENSGVTINDYCQTTNPNVYAVGDICSKYQFTHNADIMAKIAAKNAILGNELKYSDINMSWCTFTDPEVAHVGKYAHELNAADIKFDVYKINFDHNDRAIWESADGMVKFYTQQGIDIILGCTIVGGPAGDMISSVATAMINKVGLSTFGTAIHPYPTYAEAFKALSSQCSAKIKAKSK